jgi:hypothetical protein
MSTIDSYPSIYNLGHAALDELLKSEVIIEEKIDGSQFSFGKDEYGELHCRSKGQTINIDAPEALFETAVEWCRSNAHRFPAGAVFRCEYLAKPKHNVLVYERVPVNNLIVFDVTSAGERYQSQEEKWQAALDIDLECVPLFFAGKIDDLELLKSYLDYTSVLGGQKVEGIVIKPLHRDIFGKDKKLLIGKLVSEVFREVHKATWKDEHGTKTSGDILQILAREYATPARWAKARIHLAERGSIDNSVRDIGALLKEVGIDVQKECAEEIKEALFKWAWPQLKRSLTRGLPEWYKGELLKEQSERLASV